MSDITVGIKITGDGVSAERAIAGVETKLKTLASSSQKASRDISAGFNLMRNALAAAGAAISVRELTRVVDTYAGLQARLRLVSGTTNELATAQRALFAMSQQNMASLADTTQLYTRLAASIREMGRSQNDALTLTNLIGQSLRISGADATSAAAGIQQFGQALASGVLRGDEFNSVMENSPRLARALADGLNVPISALRKMAEQGELTADRVVNAILSQSDAITREYARMPQTISGALTQIGNAWMRYIGETDQANGTSREFAETLSLIAKNFDQIVGPLASTVAWIAKVEVGGWLEFQDILSSITRTLREMVGLQGPGGPVDVETRRLEAMGRGELSIEQIAGPPRGAQQAQERYFDGIRRGADAAAASLRGLSEEQQRVANRVIEAARAAKVDPALALAVARTESRFNQNAQSSAGALGVMQLMPGTARGLGVNPRDEQQNVEGGIKYLKQLSAEFKTLTEVAAAYNAGPGNVRNDRWLNFRETRDYVRKVAAAYQEFQAQLGQTDGFNIAREQFDLLRQSTQRYVAEQDARVKAAQRAADITVAQLDAERAGLERERESFDKAQQDKIKSAQGSFDAQAALEAERARTLEDYAARDLALVRKQYDARQTAIEAERAAYQQQLGNPQLSDDQQRRAREQLAAVNADLVKLANERAEAEAKAGLAARDAASGGLELQQKQREFIGGINADLEFQKQLYQQLAAAKAAGASGEGLAILRGTAEQTRQLPGVVTAAEVGRLENAIAQTKIYEQAIADLAQTEQDRTDSVREQQLRENAYWEQIISRSEQLSNIWQEISNQQVNGLGKMTMALSRYGKNVAQINTYWEDAKNQKAWGELGEMKQALEQAGAAATMLAESMLAIRANTEAGSQAYANLTTAAENFAVVAQWINVLDGIASILKQLKEGDPYTAAIRAAATAAMVASLGIQTGFAGGGNTNASMSYAARAGQADSGVLGDPSGNSDSIVNALEIIRDNSSNDLNYSAAMLRALENIEAAMGGVTNTVIRGVAPASVRTGRMSGLGDLDVGGIDPLGQLIGNLIFSTYRKIADFGIQASQQTLSEILNKGFSGQVYTDIESTTKVLGMTISKSVKTVFEGLDPAIAKQFSLAFGAITDAVREGGKAFGLTAEDFAQRMKGFIIDMGKISTKDMTGEELQTKITQMFSEQSDRIARRFMPGLGKYQQVGEGYFETFVRVAEGLNRAGGELERMGLQAISYRNIERKQADIAAEIVRETLLQQADLNDGMRTYIAELSGSAEEIVDAYKKLAEATRALRTAGLDESGLSRAMINAAGGLEAFLSGMEDFNSNFLTDSERLVGSWRNMADEFVRLNVQMPTTNDEFRALVEGIDTSTEAGQKLFGRVISLSGAFAQLTEAMATSREALKSAYDIARDQATSLRDYLAGLKTGELSTGTPLDKYQVAKDRYQALLTRARLGDASALEQLQGTASTYLELSKKSFAASGQYGIDLADVQQGLGGLAKTLEDDIALAEQQVPALNNNTDALNNLKQALADYKKSVDTLKDATKDAATKFKEGADSLIKGIDTLDRIGGGTGGTTPIGPAGTPPGSTPIGPAGAPPYANGGLAGVGWALVGERGPEIVNFSRPARVYTATETKAALSATPELLDRIEHAAAAGIKVDQAGYQALLAELQAIRAEMSEQTRAQKLKAAA